MTRRTRVIAHRGASRHRPENTLAAFDEALRQGCDGIELDVQLSRDAVPVVYHDKTLVKAGGGRRRVACVDLDDLPTHIPPLEQVLTRYGRRTQLLIEIKTREGATARERHELLARRVAGLIRKSKLESKVLVLSFDARVLADCRDEVPRVRTVLNLKPPPWVTPAIRRRLDALHALAADVRTLRQGFAGGVHRTGKPLYVYTCNTPRTVERALVAGATGVITDRPGWLVGHLPLRAAADAT